MQWTQNTQQSLQRISYISQLQKLLQSKGHQDTVIWYKNRHTDQWNRIERPETYRYIYSQMIFDKDAKIIQWGKE